MRPENKQMQEYLKANGITATPKFLHAGSLRGCWRLYDGSQSWNDALREKLTALGFADFDGKPLGKYAGNGGVFSVFVRGHNELAAIG